MTFVEEAEVKDLATWSFFNSALEVGYWLVWRNHLFPLVCPNWFGLVWTGRPNWVQFAPTFVPLRPIKSSDCHLPTSIEYSNTNTDWNTNTNTNLDSNTISHIQIQVFVDQKHKLTSTTKNSQKPTFQHFKVYNFQKLKQQEFCVFKAVKNIFRSLLLVGQRFKYFNGIQV